MLLPGYIRKAVLTQCIFMITNVHKPVVIFAYRPENTYISHHNHLSHRIWSNPPVWAHAGTQAEVMAGIVDGLYWAGPDQVALLQTRCPLIGLRSTQATYHILLVLQQQKDTRQDCQATA
jgi:hypothetical protein